MIFAIGKHVVTTFLHSSKTSGLYMPSICQTAAQNEEGE